MKKLFVTVTAIAILTLSLVAVAASEPTQETTTVSNMDATTYLELRTAQLDKALANGTIDLEQYTLLLAHIEENAESESFGRGPQGYTTRDDSTCVLGEDGGLGIFRNENSGTRSGVGNGVALKANDGTGFARGNGGSRGHGGSRGNAGSNGLRVQDGSAENADCILD